MKKKTSLLVCIALLCLGTSMLNAQNKALKQQKKPFPHWYMGAGYSVPFMFGDTYSLTEDKNHWGNRLDLKLGRRFSNIFGLEVGLYYGKLKTSARDFSHNFVLGRDGMTYYPYTLVDGIEYSVYPNLFGIWEKHTGNKFLAHLEGTKYSDIYVRTTYAQASLQGVFNLNRLFMNVPKDREQFLSVLLKPGIYLQRFSSRAYNTSGKMVAPHIKTPISIGLGGDLAIHLRLARKWALELNTSLVWASNQELDGIRTMKISHDDYMWSTGATLIYKFGHKNATYTPVEDITPLLPIAPLQLDLWYPERPTLVTPKIRSHSAAVYLTYILNKTYITPDLHNNSAELARLNKEMEHYLNHPDYQVKNIRIEGFASPEGPYDNNMRLAEGRARSIIDYIVSHTGMDRGMFTVGRMNENWEGLKDTLQKNAGIPGRDAFLALIQKEKDTEKRKESIKSLPHYKELLENVYPYLRLSSYTVEYEVKAYQGKEARILIQENPSLLSAEEMYAVATEAGLHSEEGKSAIATLYSYYPEADITRAYRGIEAAMAGKYAEAIQDLEKVATKTPAVLNALGVAYAHQKEHEKAIEYLDKAAFDSTEARKNLAILKAHLKQ